MKFLKQSLVQASIITIGATFLSRIVGFLREAITAGYFGTEAIFDTFIIAITVPELISSLSFIVLPTAILPALQKRADRIDTDKSEAFWTGLIIFAVFFSVVSALVYASRSLILNALASSLEPDQFSEGMILMSILSWLIFFRGIESYFRSWLFKRKQFVVPAASNIFINIVILIVLVSLYNKYNIEALAYGWLIGASLFCILSGIITIRILKPRFIIRPGSGIELFKATILVSIIEGIPLLYPAIDRFFAAKYLGEGQIAALRYAIVLILTPASIFVMSFNVASFPWISDYSSSDRSEKLTKLYKDSIRLLIYTMGITSAGIIIYSKEIVKVVFQRGAFDSQSLMLTYEPFMYYAMGLLFYSIFTFQNKFYFAQKRLTRLGIIFLTLLIIKVIFNRCLVLPLEQNGLALATVAAWFAGFAIMSLDLNRQLKIKIDFSALKYLLRMMIPLSVVSCYWLLIRNAWLTISDEKNIIVFIKLVLIAISGLALYILLSFVFKVQEGSKIHKYIKSGLPSTQEGKV